MVVLLLSHLYRESTFRLSFFNRTRRELEMIADDGYSASGPNNIAESPVVRKIRPTRTETGVKIFSLITVYRLSGASISVNFLVIAVVIGR